MDESLTRQFDPDGKELSGGQWQRVSLARAFFRDAPIILLDEPSAALDPIAEHEIFKDFANISKDNSALLISHRLSSITLADRILVLEDGHIIEQGSHEVLIIGRRQKTALLGLNGAGKTALIKLLCGLHEPTEGVILIGGQDITEFSQKSLYTLFSVVFQDYINYNLPLSDSLSLGRGKADSREIWNALSAVGADALRIKRFDNNISKFIGRNVDENGIELSGREHQKIVLARVLLQNRAMTILDEPTASLDTFAERLSLLLYRKLTKRT